MFLPILEVAAALTWPPVLPGGVSVDSGSSPDLLTPTATLQSGVAIAREAPTVDFLYYDCQDYEPPKGALWSHWGDGLFVGDVFYSSLGDHAAPEGNAFVYACDVKSKTSRKLLDLRSVLKQPEGRYTPGKIHSQLGMGRDGWLYFSTHRGSTRIASHPTAQFRGDWILRHHPGTGATEVVAHAPLEMQSLPAGQLDPERLIFYIGTADGKNEDPPRFLAYDLEKRRVLFSSENGPSRALILSSSSGRVWFHPGKDGAAPLSRFDPAQPDGLTPISAEAGLRCATTESADGWVYTIDRGGLWSFDTKSETVKALGSPTVGAKDYITSVDLDPKTGRYLYYVPGSHGGAEDDGSPLVQYDVRTGARKVICFLHPHLHRRHGYIAQGSYASAVSADGATVAIVWNGNRGATDAEMSGAKKGYKFNTCALTLVHIPESERPE